MAGAACLVLARGSVGFSVLHVDAAGDEETLTPCVGVADRGVSLLSDTETWAVGWSTGW
jgi:hypothetical protein